METTIYFGQKKEIRHGWGISTDTWCSGLCVYMKQMEKKKKKTDSKLWTILEIVSDGSHQRLEVHYII